MPMISIFRTAHRSMHALSFVALALLAIAAFAYTVASASGYAPWLTFEAQVGEWFFPEAGPVAQIALTSILVALMFFAPSTTRIMALENSHRRFNLSMNDVARAYHYCHTADRAGVFTMSSEFDQVRERLAYLRDHPDLEQLEPEVMEVAAQMSQQSRHLAETYNDQKVARAREFLEQRQAEAERQQEKIVEALHACREIKRWREQVEVEEAVVASQLAQLEEQLELCLPDLGITVVRDDDNVTRMPMQHAAE
ncbi:DNA repair protein [Pelagovum pacificum]|uniref:DNA repair protein n=1 Tax=Pelagovum pacificum TaxID=2588711 RepID=A0A5C5GDK1_9RHOB|nr:DNA repair protein [Pelagovum pacificum]QQA44079.1 DNA repair protein [Pelagovum pacificum]TNY32793.1 DNA repair protein [Pelagovum pacificum]